MAYANLTPIVIGERNTGTVVATADRYTSVTTEGAKFYWLHADRRTLIEVSNLSGNSDVTITIKGNDKYSVNLDIVEIVAKGTCRLFELDSELYMQSNPEGENVGCVVLVPSEAVNVAVIALI